MSTFVKEVRPEKRIKGELTYKKIAPGVSLVMGPDSSGQLVAHKWVFERTRQVSSYDAIERWFKQNLGKDPVAYALSVEKDVAEFDGVESFSKTATTLSKEGGALAGVLEPTDEQMEKIQPYLLSPKTPDQLAVFPVLACNTLVDRDDDAFMPDTIQKFLDLPEGLGYKGKSFFWDHQHKAKQAIGRIFDTQLYEFEETDPVTGAEYQTGVKEWVYVPNTEQHKSMLENLDYGLLWAVSVGARLGQYTCSLDGSPMSAGYCGGADCDKGHMKGYWYQDLEQDEEAKNPSSRKKGDNWHFIWGQFKDPIEGMETSMVWLGAQYGAQVPSAQKTVMSVTKGYNGNYANLGRTDASLIREVLKVTLPVLSADRGKVPDAHKLNPEHTVPKETNKDVEGGDMDLKEFLEKLNAAGFPVEDIEQLVGLGPEKAAEVLGRSYKSATEDFEDRAKLGDEWLDGARADIRKFYRISRCEDPTLKESIDQVDMGLVDSILASVGRDPTVLKGLLQDYEKSAKSRFPRAVTRSSAPDISFLGANEGQEDGPSQVDPAVSRLHS